MSANAVPVEHLSVTRLYPVKPEQLSHQQRYRRRKLKTLVIPLKLPEPPVGYIKPRKHEFY